MQALCQICYCRLPMLIVNVTLQVLIMIVRNCECDKFPKTQGACGHRAATLPPAPPTQPLPQLLQTVASVLALPSQDLSACICILVMQDCNLVKSLAANIRLGARLSAGRRDGCWQRCGPAVFRLRVDRLLL